MKEAVMLQRSGDIQAFAQKTMEAKAMDEVIESLKIER